MDRAESVAQEALTILPREPSLHFNLANTLGKTGRFIEAEKHFTEAITLDMKNAVYYTNLGKWLVSIGILKIVFDLYWPCVDY
jgi:Flp pilus assembly protein TadD